MLLAVDVGNTQTVIGFFSGDTLLENWRISTEDTMTADEIRVKLESLFALVEYGVESIGSVVVGSVVPNLTDTWLRVAEMLGVEKTLVVDHTINTGLEITFDNPAEAGADRIATVVAATERYGVPLIVIDFGTATTLDVVNSKNEYLGGTIGAGVEISANTLFESAARLSEVELELPPNPIGTDTITSIQSGVVLGEAVKVDGLVRLVEEQIGEKAHVIATGGLAPRVAPACETVQALDSGLTLDGLLLLAKKNCII